MKSISSTNPLVKCSELDTFDFDPWKNHKMTRVSVDDDQMEIKVIKKP